MVNLFRTSLGVMALAAAALGLGGGAHAANGPFLAHQALYDLSLVKSRSNSINSARGRILYSFAGSACEGYTSEFRQVSELDTGEGKISTSDLRSTTWEGADARNFKFSSQNFVDENLIDSVDGHAEREATKTAVALEKPQPKILSLAPGVVFPTEHMVRVINAARAGQTQLAVAAKMLRMKADADQSVVQLLQAGQANIDKLANVASGIGGNLDVSV